MELKQHIQTIFKDKIYEMNNGEITYNFKTENDRYYSTIQIKNKEIYKIEATIHTKLERYTIHYHIKPRIIIPDDNEIEKSILTKSPVNKLKPDISIPFLDFDLSLNKE